MANKNLVWDCYATPQVKVMSINMSDELHEFFILLEKKVTVIFYRWKMFKQLYSNDPAIIELLNKASSLVFSELQSLMFANIILSISKLTDPAAMKGNKNISIGYMIKTIFESGNVELSNELTANLEELKVLTKKFKKLRDKQIAHSDLDFEKGKESVQISPILATDIDTALDKISKIMNIINKVYYNKTTLYNEVLLSPKSNVYTLIKTLKRAF